MWQRRLRKREGRMKSRMQAPVCLPTACSSSSQIPAPLLRRAGLQLLKGHLRWDSYILNNKALLLQLSLFRRTHKVCEAFLCTDSAPCQTWGKGWGWQCPQGWRGGGTAWHGVTLQQGESSSLCSSTEQETCQQGKQGSAVTKETGVTAAAHSGDASQGCGTQEGCKQQQQVQHLPVRISCDTGQK